MSRFFIFERPDGALAITHVVDKTLDEDVLINNLLQDKNHEGFILKEKTDTYPNMSPDFFKCYVYTDIGVVLDMAKAREEWRNQLRQRRIPVLDKLDIEFQRALEVNDTKKQAEIVANKNILRDCTANPAIETATNIFELKQTLPNLLKE